MVTVKNNKITMTRGDSLNLKIAIIKNKYTSSNLPNSKEILTEEDLEGCEIKFAMSRFFPGQLNYKLLFTKDIPISTRALILDPEDTKNIPLGIYNYDIKLITPATNSQEEAKIDTFISGTIQLLGECEGEEGIINDYIYEDPDNGTVG